MSAWVGFPRSTQQREYRGREGWLNVGVFFQGDIREEKWGLGVKSFWKTDAEGMDHGVEKRG